MKDDRVESLPAVHHDPLLSRVRADVLDDDVMWRVGESGMPLCEWLGERAVHARGLGLVSRVPEPGRGEGESRVRVLRRGP